MNPLTDDMKKKPLISVRRVALLAAAFFIGGAVLASGWPASAQQVEQMHGRVSFSSGNGMVKGANDTEWSYATINTLVLGGDTIWVDQTGTLELELSGGTFLRLADGSKAEIAALPPSAAVRGWTGSYYVHRVSRSTGDMLFQAPSGNITVARDSQVRFDVLASGATTVTVRWGQAVIRADGDETVVGAGQRSYIDPGLLPSEPRPFDRNETDAFDDWNRERAQLLAVGEEAIPAHISTKAAPIGVSDLAGYGEWVTVDNEPYWRPTVVVDYVPYRYGHWSYVPAYGYCWVGGHPFSYVTSHYGRWTHRSNYGWLWTYRDTWGPAWVASVRYGSNFVWTPLDPFDRPFAFDDDYFTYGRTRFGIWGSSYCSADDLLVYGAPSVYVHPLTPVIIRDVPYNQVNVWNINININTRDDRDHHRGRDFYRRVYGDDFDFDRDVRDYHPRRVIRGPSHHDDVKIAAVDRVTRLEREGGRERFAPAGSEQRRGIRTADVPDVREARKRSVRVQPEAMTKVAERADLVAARAPNERTRDRAREISMSAKREAEKMPALGSPDLAGPKEPRVERGERPERGIREGAQPGGIAPRERGEGGQVAERPARERTPGAIVPEGVAPSDPREAAERGERLGARGTTRPGTPGTKEGAAREPGAVAERGRDRDRTPATGPEGGVTREPGAVAERGRERDRDRTPATGPEGGVTPRTGGDVAERTPAEPRERAVVPGETPTISGRGRVRTAAPDEGARPEVRQPERSAPERTVPRAEGVGTKERTPDAVTETPERVGRGVEPETQRTQPRAAEPTLRTEPRRVERTEPRVAQPERTPAPEVQRTEPRRIERTEPRVAQPERTPAPQIQRVEPRRIERTEPRVAQPERTPAPQIQRTEPRRIERTEPRMAQPERTPAPQIQRVEPRSIQRSEPRIAQPEQRSMPAPQVRMPSVERRAPEMKSPEMPRRESSMSAPRRESSMSAPQRISPRDIGGLDGGAPDRGRSSSGVRGNRR